MLKITLRFANALLIAAVIVAGQLITALAEDWSQFRGPNGSGVSVSSNLPVEFGPGKNMIWKTDLPPGHSSPVLTRDRIYVTAYNKGAEKEKDHKLLVISLDRQTGKILWQREVPRSPPTSGR